MVSLKKSRYSESLLMANMDQLPCAHITTAFCGLTTSAWQTIFLTPTRIAKMPQIETIGTVLYMRVGRCVVRIDATHNTSQRLLLPTLRATFVAHIVCLMFFRLNPSVQRSWQVKTLLLVLTKLAQICSMRWVITVATARCYVSRYPQTRTRSRCFTGCSQRVVISHRRV